MGNQVSQGNPQNTLLLGSVQDADLGITAKTVYHRQSPDAGLVYGVIRDEQPGNEYPALHTEILARAQQLTPLVIGGDGRATLEQEVGDDRCASWTGESFEYHGRSINTAHFAEAYDEISRAAQITRVIFDAWRQYKSNDTVQPRFEHKGGSGIPRFEETPLDFAL